jgi:hypothetical protein
MAIPGLRKSIGGAALFPIKPGANVSFVVLDLGF